MKKLICSLLVVGSLFMFTGCGDKTNVDNNDNNQEQNQTTTNLTLTPTEIVQKMYEGFGEDELPMLESRELTKEELEYNLGLTELDFKEGVVNEPMMGSIAHSVVLVRMKEGVDVAATVADIKAKVNPRKWVCVEAETVLVESKGDIIVLVMSNNDTATRLMDNFKKIN